MANLDLSKYGIQDVKEIIHNPSYDVLFAEETKQVWKVLKRSGN